MGIFDFSTNAGDVTRAGNNANTAARGRASTLTTLVNNTFADPRREQQTQDFMGALRTRLGDQTNKDFTRTARNTKFATARAGLTGGRVDVDRQGNNLNDLFERRISNEGQVQDAGNTLRQQDEGQRAALVKAAYGISDAGSGATQGLLQGSANSANNMNAVWARLFANTASGLAGAYGDRANSRAYYDGFTPKWTYQGNLPSEVGGLY